MERMRISALPGPLQRRTLWRLIQEGCGGAPSRALLDKLADDLREGRLAKHTIPGGWTLELNKQELVLVPPCLDSSGEPLEAAWTQDIPLKLEGVTPLPDGRSLRTSWVEQSGDADRPGDPDCVELDARALPPALTVRLPRNGDCFQALGAPGQRKLSRFLADAGVSAPERKTVPLVLAGDEIIWVAGVRPGDRHRLRPATARRLRLTLEPAGDPMEAEDSPPLPALRRGSLSSAPSQPGPSTSA